MLSQRDGLIRALQALPPRQRAVIVLRYLNDLPEAEVAVALGCSVGSLKSHASRGLARLRESTHLSLPPGGGAADLAAIRAGVRSYRADFSAMIDGRIGFVSVRAEWGPTGTLDEVAERARASGSSFDSYSRTTVRGHPAIQRGNAAKAEFGVTWIERDGLVLAVDGGTPITFDEIRQVAEALVVPSAPPPATPDLDAAIQAAASQALRAGVPAAEAVSAVDATDTSALVAARTSFAAAYPGFASTASVRLLATAPRAADRVDIQLSLTFSDPRLRAYQAGPSGDERVFGGEAIRTPTGWKITRDTYCGAVMMICTS